MIHRQNLLNEIFLNSIENLKTFGRKNTKPKVCVVSSVDLVQSLDVWRFSHQALLGFVPNSEIFRGEAPVGIPKRRSFLGLVEFFRFVQDFSSFGSFLRCTQLFCEAQEKFFFSREVYSIDVD